jgi:DNA repair protein RadC
VFRLAVAMGATSLVVAHNHPSGVLTPSAEDKAVTRQLVSAGRLLDIPVHDHLIVGLTPDEYYSFAESGQL